MVCVTLGVMIQTVRLASDRHRINGVLEVLEVRDGVYVAGTLFSLDRRDSGQFVCQAVPIGQKFRQVLL